MSSLYSASTLSRAAFERSPLNQTKLASLLLLPVPVREQASQYDKAAETEGQCRPEPSSQFSLWRASKETVKGICRPITTLLQHPFKSALALAGTVTLTSVAPITIPIMVVTGLASSGWQILKGLKTAVSEAQQGNYTASEKAFGHIGEGGFGLISSLLGIRQAGSIAAESKAARLSLSPTASVSEKVKAVDQGLEAAVKIQNGSWQQAFQETLGIFSPAGAKTLSSQLNPQRLARLLHGKLQHLRSQFTDSPVVSLEKPLAKAQRFLKMKNQDMPDVHPQLQDLNGTDLSAHLHGFYSPKNHSLHVEPDRLKAFRNRLIPPLQSWFDKLPKPIQTFMGNRNKQGLPLSEIITHELTHARQFNQVAALTSQQALQTLQAKFPGVSTESLQALCKQFRFNGTGTPAMQQAGQRILTQVAEYRLTESNLKHIRLQGLGEWNAAEKVKNQLQLLKSYVRAGFEIEARQKAAEAGLAQLVQQLSKSPDYYQQNQLLQHYKTLKVEGKLNKLLSRLNSTSAKLTPKLAGQTQRQLMEWAQFRQTDSLTQRYLLNEQKLESTAETLRKLHHWSEAQKQARASQSGWSLKSLGTQLGSWVKSCFSGIRRLFSPAGLRKVEPKLHSLKGSYLQNAQQLSQLLSPPAESA